MAQREPYIGRPMPRLEDDRLVLGKGRYTDDFQFPGQLWAAFVRSPYPAARILAVDGMQATEAPGVVAVLSGQDYLDEGFGPISHFADPADARDHTMRAFGGYPGAIAIDIPHLPMPIDVVRYLGEPLTVVIAETQAQAVNACELVSIDLEELPFVLSPAKALQEGAPQVDGEIPGNLAVVADFGDRSSTEAALARAVHVVEGRFPSQRIVGCQMEPRSAIATFDPSTGKYLMVAGSQGAIRHRDTLAAALRLPREKIEVICPDVGGGFGPRTNLSPEQPILALAAKRTGRPVRWTSSRSEAFLTDYQARDLTFTARLGLDSEGRIVGYESEILANVGAYTVSFVPMANSYRICTTVYDVPAAYVSIRGAMTNTVPTVPFRGAGRPEAHFAIERLLDMAARRIGIDRAEIRRRNLIRQDSLPYTTPMGLVYDSGDFEGNMARVLANADWMGFPDRRAAARARSRLAGISVANYVEAPVGIPHERVDVSVSAEGFVEVVVGTQSTGQGHETTFAQIMADRFGVRPEDIRIVSGDTRRVISGGGSHSDRTMRIAGTLIVETSAQLIEKARAILAFLLGYQPAAVRFEDGRFSPAGRNESYSIFDVARMAADDPLPDELQAGLCASASFTGRIPAHPTGAAVCELEVDPLTGEIEITRYTTVDDVGQPINPLIVDGQTHGGIAQGVGQALLEWMVSDAETGQVITGSFMDYGIARALHVPSFDTELVQDPTESNPLRVKGGGEGGIVPALATVMNAVMNALSELGVEHLDMPASPARVWDAIEIAKARHRTPS